jgi:hypothetical protein
MNWVTIDQLRPGDVISTSRYVNRVVRDTQEGYIIRFVGDWANDTLHAGEKVCVHGSCPLVMDGINVHVFEDTGDAYDQTQYRDDIEFGDVLVIPSEQVVGFLLSAWPVAVTTEHGKLHFRTPNGSWERACTRSEGEIERGHRDYKDSYRAAVKVAKQLSFPLYEEAQL